MAVIGWMVIFDVIIQIVLILADYITLLTSEPMLAFFVGQSSFAHMRRPSLETPTTLDLVVMVCRIVEMIAHPIVVEAPSTALIHGCWQC